MTHKIVIHEQVARHIAHQCELWRDNQVRAHALGVSNPSDNSRSISPRVTRCGVDLKQGKKH
jgi:hypothetical protein